MAWQLRRQADRQYYPSFCLARLAGSILVVAIHGAPFPPRGRRPEFSCTALAREDRGAVFLCVVRVFSVPQNDP